MAPHDGRFAPSPTGDLHVGNLRTALVAWLAARRHGGRFLVRMEDLDRVTASVHHERAQLRDLAALGLDWDGEVIRQSDRFDRYRDALADLERRGLTYRCWCSRREIREAASAPQQRRHPRSTATDTPDESRFVGESTVAGGALAVDAPYPGTCRHLSAAQTREREARGRPPALRLLADANVVDFVDQIHGPIRGVADDIVIRRGDGVPAYHLAVVIDDHDQDVGTVVRGDDLLSSVASQAHLGTLLGQPMVRYAHVPLVLAPNGDRLAKRHGAVALDDLADAGYDAPRVLGLLAASLGLHDGNEAPTAQGLVEHFDVGAVPRTPWIFDPEAFLP